jgi:hypothetical protein
VTPSDDDAKTGRCTYEDPSGSLPAIVVPRLMGIQDAAKYLSATTWQVETLLREKVIPRCAREAPRGRPVGTGSI